MPVKVNLYKESAKELVSKLDSDKDASKEFMYCSRRIGQDVDGTVSLCLWQACDEHLFWSLAHDRG